MKSSYNLQIMKVKKEVFTQKIRIVELKRR